MSKKIIILVFCFIFIYACGKKNEPVYKESNIYIFDQNKKKI